MYIWPKKFTLPKLNIEIYHISHTWKQLRKRYIKIENYTKTHENILLCYIKFIVPLIVGAVSMVGDWKLWIVLIICPSSLNTVASPFQKLAGDSSKQLYSGRRPLALNLGNTSGIWRQKSLILLVFPLRGKKQTSKSLEMHSMGNFRKISIISLNYEIEINKRFLIL